VNRYELAADILTQIQACLGADCTYALIRSRGVPPAECDSIIVTFADAIPYWDADCFPNACVDHQDHTMRVVLTRQCLLPDVDETFNFAAEDAEVQCFWRDLETLERCLDCSDLSQVYLDNGVTRIQRLRTQIDATTLGGAHSATLTFRVVENYCCPAP